MKALTLWQPWASAVALGLKQYETRSWSTDYRGSLAIHASSKKPTRLDRLQLKPLFDQLPASLPYGEVICIVDLVEIIPTNAEHRLPSAISEWTWGDMSPGRFAWKLENLRVLAVPISARGYQQLWTWDQALESLEFKRAA